MDTWLPFGRMPLEGNHLASLGRLAGRQSSLHVCPTFKTSVKIGQEVN